MKSLKLVPLVLALTLTFSTLAHAQVKFSFPEESKTFAVNLTPGEETTVDVTFTNISPKTVKVNSYTVDGTNTTTGSFAAKLLSDPQVTLGNWSSFASTYNNIESKKSLTLPLTISIPANTTPGDYSGAVAMEYSYLEDTPTETEETESTNINQVSTGVTFSMRYAKPFYVKVEGVIKHELVIGELAFNETQKNNYRAIIPFENKGNTAVTIKINPTGKTLLGEAYLLKEQEITLFPQQQLSLPVELGNLGLFNIYDFKTDIVYSVHDVVSGSETPLGTASREGKLYVITWIYIIIALVTLLLIVTILISRKVYYKNIIKKSSAYTVKQGDTLSTIANKQGVSWKLLAKINNLKEPYEVKTEQIIIVPTSKKKINRNK